MNTLISVLDMSLETQIFRGVRAAKVPGGVIIEDNSAFSLQI